LFKLKACFKPSLESLEDRTLLNAGALDPSFGMGGEVTTDFGSSDFIARSLLQTDGKIVAVGSTLVGSSSDFALARYNVDGSLDMSFGVGGKVTSPLGFATDAVLQANGDIVVTGGQSSQGQQGGPLVVARYTPSGTLDSTFGTAGVVMTDVVEPATAGVAIQQDGKIVVASSVGIPPDIARIELLRYNADGTLDQTFGSAGKVTDVGTIANRVLVDSGGKILIAVTGVPTLTEGPAFFVKRYDADGSVDGSFQQLVNLGSGPNSAEDVALQADGKIVALAFSHSRPVLVRLNSDGGMDASFGVNGQVLIGFGRALAIQQDGDIVVTGISENALLVARYLPDGSLDTRFGAAGTASAPFPQGVVAEDVKVQADGKILASGWSNKITAMPGVTNMLHIPGLFPEEGIIGKGFDTSDFALVRFVGGPSGPLTGTPNQRFVQQVYLDVLARVADSEGLAFWSGLLDRSLANRTQVAAAIESSHESHTLVVQALYRRLLLRPADPSGQATWTSFLDQGGTVENLTAIFLGSDEYKGLNFRSVAEFSGHNDFVEALYRDVLYRYADSDGEQAWQQLVDGGASHQAVAQTFLASPESDTDEVEDLYHRFLHRQADAAGLNGFVNTLQQGGTNEQVMAVLLGSDEYFQRAQQ
jgi:uncharacterized delta-60 repeat protein